MNRRVLMMILSIVLAFVGTACVFLYVRSADTRAVAAKAPVRVFMVVKAVPAGTSVADVLAGGFLREDSVPSEARPSDAVTATDQLPEAEVALAALPTGSVVVRSQFGTAAPVTSGMVIPDGMVAVTVEVSQQEDVASLVQTGSDVAVFSTYAIDATGKPVLSTPNLPNQADYDYQTRLALPRVRVLAVTSSAPVQAASGSATTETSAGGGSGDASVSAGSAAQDTGVPVRVTLAVTQADAERLVHLQQTSVITLGLLSPSSTTTAGPGVDSSGRTGTLYPVGDAATSSVPEGTP